MAEREWSNKAAVLNELFTKEIAPTIKKRVGGIEKSVDATSLADRQRHLANPSLSVETSLDMLKEEYARGARVFEQLFTQAVTALGQGDPKKMRDLFSIARRVVIGQEEKVEGAEISGSDDYTTLFGSRTEESEPEHILGVDNTFRGLNEEALTIWERKLREIGVI